MSLPTTYNLLQEFPNKYFVETGSYRGDAIQLALDAGFTRIRSCDIDKANIEFCKNRFDMRTAPATKPGKFIRLFTGDSATLLTEMIDDIYEPITFWLDSHWQLFEDEPKGEHPFPLLNELAQIAQHSVKNHTILIDDILYLTHPKITGWNLHTIKNYILEINPAYKIKLIANPVIDNLLIATI